MLKELFVVGFLGFNAWMDVRKKEISILTVVAFAAGALLALGATEGISKDVFLSAGISSFFMAISLLTKGAFGLGDCLVLLALGIALKAEEFLITLFLGLGGSALWAGILLLVFRRGRDTEMPFIPFLFLGYVGGVLLWR